MDLIDNSKYYVMDSDGNIMVTIFSRRASAHCDFMFRTFLPFNDVKKILKKYKIEQNFFASHTNELVYGESMWAMGYDESGKSYIEINFKEEFPDKFVQLLREYNQEEAIKSFKVSFPRFFEKY